jgi:hypothetical protein
MFNWVNIAYESLLIVAFSVLALQLRGSIPYQLILWVLAAASYPCVVGFVGSKMTPFRDLLMLIVMLLVAQLLGFIVYVIIENPIYYRGDGSLVLFAGELIESAIVASVVYWIGFFAFRAWYRSRF